MVHAAAYLLLSGLAFASPVKRQATSTSVVASTSTVAAAAPASSSGSLSAISINTAGIASARSSASASSSASSAAVAPVPVPVSASSSASASASSASPVFNPYAGTCPTGYSLTYEIAQQNVNANLSEVTPVVANWTGDSWLNAQMGKGGEMVNATRTLVNNLVANQTEILTAYNITADTGAITQTWNLTNGPLRVSPELTISNYSTELQVYRNDTLSTETQNVTTIKWFTNFCANNQTLGASTIAAYIQAAFANLNASEQAYAASSASSSMPASSSAASSRPASSAASSAAAGGILPSTSSRASSASSSAAVVVTSTSVASTTAAAASSTAASGTLMINTPASLLTCQPAAVTFSGGQAPYFLSVLPAGQVSAAPLEQFPEQSAPGIYTWNVNLAAGTAITLQVRDNTGAVNYAAPVTILAGSSTSCISS